MFRPWGERRAPHAHTTFEPFASLPPLLLSLDRSAYSLAHQLNTNRRTTISQGEIKSSKMSGDAIRSVDTIR